MPSGGGDATLDPPQNEKCVFYFSDEVVQELADALSNGGILKEDEDEGEEDRDGNDNVIFKGNLDLEEAGLTKDTLRRLVLASYVTQATVGTELGIEVSYEELLETLDPNELSQLATSNETTPDEAGYYYVRLKDDTTGEDVYYTATRGSIKIENENGDLMTCVNNETFDYYVNWFNGNVGIPIGNGQLGKNTAITMYTVKEIGTIEMITVTTSSNGAYSFSTKTINYANNSEISECMVPIELLVDFLQFSASPQFLEAFERLIINQDITLRVFSLTTQETIVTERTYPIDIILNARKDLTFIKTSNSEGEYTILPDENGQVETASAGRDLTYNIASLQHTVQTTETTSSTDYDIKLISADSWYFKADRTVTKSTVTTYEYYDAEGQSTAFTPSGENSLENAEGYDIGGFNITGIQSIDTLRSQLMSMLNTDSINLDTQIADINNKLQDRSDVQDIIDSYTSNQYVLQSYQSSISGITASSAGGTEKKVKTTVQDMLVTGTMEYEDNTDAFLGLWKNESGHYEEGATFDPDGKKVPYTDLYSGNKETAYVGDLFENADEMLFDVLEFSEHTQSYSAVMKYILYRYTGTDYGVTDFETLLRLMGLRTVSTGDYNVNTNSTAGEALKIVDTEDGVSAEQHLIDGINSVVKYKTAAQNYLPYVDTLIELQERYGVNAAWIVAQGCLETGGGAAGSALTNNNWYGLGYNGSTYNSYSSPEECFEDMARTVAQTGPYFRDGRETITEISYMWVNGVAYDASTADPNWWYVADGKEIVRDILTGAGIDVSSIMGGNILEVCAQVTDHYNAIGAVYSVNAGELIYGNIEACWDNPYICCATYATMVLYQSGMLTAEQINPYNYHWTGDGGIPTMLRDAGWYQVPASEMQPGDVLNRNGYHVMIYAGNGQVWDQNTCTGRHYTGPFTTNVSGYDVWRAP